MRGAARVMTASTGTVRETPKEFFTAVDAQFCCTIDVCALPTNKKLPRFFSPQDNGLAQSWEGENAWGNYPYGREIGDWLAKGRHEAMYARAVVVQLLPARVDTSWWRTFVLNQDGRAGRLLTSKWDPAAQVLWLRWEGLITGVYHHDQRLPFDDAETGAPFPSSLVWHISPSRSRWRGRVEGDVLPDLLAGWPR